MVWDGVTPPDGRIILEEGGVWNRRDPLPHGYHTLDGETLLIHAPRKAHPLSPGQWGAFVPLHAVRENATVADLRAYYDWIRELGGDFVATLPLLASFDAEPSPYSPVSRLYWNERYRIDEPFAPGDDFEKFAKQARDYAEFRGDAGHHLRAQYQMSKQMRALASSARLYLDFPLGVHRNGYDVHRYPHCFVEGVSVGAPPDSFFPKGQNWGFPPLDPEGIRKDRYEYFRAAIRHHVSHASVLRLDHVMGLHRVYWIPEGKDATEGHYVHYRSEELYAIVILESVRHRCAIVGEDLGTVPKYVPAAMQRHGLRRMFVVQYEAADRKSPLPEPPRECVAYVNTHDMPPFASWWKDTATRDDALQSILLFLAESQAEIVLVNLEDLWGETEPQNVPGQPEKSWKQRFRLSLEEARQDPRVRRILRSVGEARALLSSGRAQ